MWVRGPESMRKSWLASGALVIALAALLVFTSMNSSPAADASLRDSAGAGVLPCKRKLALTAVFRTDGKIRFEGVAEQALAGTVVKVYEIKSDEVVATTRIRQDGTWWANSTTSERRYTWLSKFVAEAGPTQSRWRRLGQAVAIRERQPVIEATRGQGSRATSGRTKIRVKVSGDGQSNLKVGVQTGCSRYEVDPRLEVETNSRGVATFTLPRPESGEPFLVYRASTRDGLKISPPIVVKPGG